MNVVQKKGPIIGSPSGFFSILICALGSAFPSCNQPFEPRGELDQKAVIFCVLSTDRNAQFVRVERDYMPIGYDPVQYVTDNSILDATVSITGGGSTLFLSDTALSRIDTSRYNFPMRAYVIDHFRPAYGASYELRVESRQMAATTARVIIPARPLLKVELSALAVFDKPDDHDSTAELLFPITLGDGTAGYVGRLFIDYEVLNGGEWVSGRQEVPSGFFYSGLRSYDYLAYPELRYRSFTPKTACLFYNQFYKRTIVDLAYKKFYGSRIIFDRVVLQLMQVDQNVYSYYSLTHPGRDPYSIRLDDPMYSNVVNGVGMVGAYTLDSLVHPLPEDFWFNRF